MTAADQPRVDAAARLASERLAIARARREAGLRLTPNQRTLLESASADVTPEALAVDLKYVATKSPRDAARLAAIKLWAILCGDLDPPAGRRKRAR